MKPVLMGIDLGTSSTKTVIVGQDGDLLSCATEEYAVDMPRPGWAEQSPQRWLQAAVRTMAQALEAAKIDPAQVAAIGLSGQMHGLVCLDERGQVLRPAIIWADQRSSRQVEKVRKLAKLAEWTANPVMTGFMLPSWLWLVDEEPETCRATRHLLLPKDYLRYELTGELGSEPSDACSTLLFDTVNRCWSVPLLETLGIDSGLIPPIHESAEVAGGLRSEIASATGLPAGAPVIYGGSDQSMQALANGVFEPGVVLSAIATGGVLFASTYKPVYDPELRLHLFCHALPDRWHLQAAVLSAGLSLRWLRDNVFEGASYQELADAASGAPPGAEGLLFAPYLAGERTPYMDPHARASFTGLTLRHRRAHIVRAVMEGVVMSLRQGLSLMQDLGAPVDRVVATAGGIRHLLWLRLQADVFNRPIYRTETVEASALGAAMLAGVGIGIYPDIPSACEKVVRWHDEAVQPAPENVERYDQIYRTFTEIYPATSRLHSE